MDKLCYIIRGVSGSGKSTLALQLANQDIGKIFEADSYLIDEDGNYNWTPDNMLLAHYKCFHEFQESCEVGVSPVVVSNTNTSPKEFQKYIDAATAEGYTVISLVVENRHGGKDTHCVPEATLERQEQRIRSSLKLR